MKSNQFVFNENAVEGVYVWNVTELQPDRTEVECSVLVTFDKEKSSNYPHNMTDKQVHIIEAELPFWADFFKDQNRRCLRTHQISLTDTKVPLECLKFLGPGDLSVVH